MLVKPRRTRLVITFVEIRSILGDSVSFGVRRSRIEVAIGMIMGTRDCRYWFTTTVLPSVILVTKILTRIPKIPLRLHRWRRNTYSVEHRYTTSPSRFHSWDTKKVRLQASLPFSPPSHVPTTHRESFQDLSFDDSENKK
jgi:hypothetical protein